MTTNRAEKLKQKEKEYKKLLPELKCVFKRMTEIVIHNKDYGLSPVGEEICALVEATIYAKDANYNEGDVVEFIMEEDKNILIRMTRIGDYEKKRQSFELTEDGKVYIYAVGEGTHGDMYDYAWIENSETGRVVWEMTYRKTERAGGARKNRLFDDTVYLKEGEYDVYYRTDDSHSFEEWNDSPPYDPESWGITIYSANTNN